MFLQLDLISCERKFIVNLLVSFILESNETESSQLFTLSGTLYFAFS